MFNENKGTFLYSLGQSISPFIGSLFGYTVTNGDLLAILLDSTLPEEKQSTGVKGNQSQ